MVRKYLTKISGDYNDYILGRITGIMYCICDRPNNPEVPHGLRRRTNRVTGAECYILTTHCTEEQYIEFTDIVYEMFHELVKFDFAYIESGMRID